MIISPENCAVLSEEVARRQELLGRGMSVTSPRPAYGKERSQDRVFCHRDPH